MFGNRLLNKLLRLLRRRAYVLAALLATTLLYGLIIFAVKDFISTASQKEQTTQAAVLESELANFLLAVRDDGGGTLLDNPKEVARAERPLMVQMLKKPFFTYFLRRSNAAYIRSDAISWEAPPQCAVEFQPPALARSADASYLQACFAMVDGDPSGRYIYFSVKYPTNSPLVRHTRGGNPLVADHILLRIKGEKTVDIKLVYELPSLVKARYPSQAERFNGIHEVTGYFQDGQPVRWIGAQAYERQEQDQPGQVVTVLGRFDAAAIVVAPDNTERFAEKLREISFGLEVYSGSSPRAPTLSVKPGTAGLALVSLEQAYLANVQSKSQLRVFRDGESEPIWASDTSPQLKAGENAGAFQKLSDSWTRQLLSFWGTAESVPLTASQNLLGPRGLRATLTSTPGRLPDIATRLLLWFSFASLALLILVGMAGFAVVRLHQIAATAYSMVRSGGTELERFCKGQDELSTFARVLDVLIRKGKLRDREKLRRQVNEMRATQEVVKARHAVLEALGHEIRSPLQSLMNRAERGQPFGAELDRVRRAVEVLFEATSLDGAVAAGKFVLERIDLADFARAYAENNSVHEDQIAVSGCERSVMVICDEIWIEQVLNNLVDNARRYRDVGTPIQIGIVENNVSARIEVYNVGRPIEDDRLENIFDYGTSRLDSEWNRGIGLFMARLYVASMKGAIWAENRQGGVAFIVELPKSSA